MRVAKAISGGQDNAPGQGAGGTAVGLPVGTIVSLMPPIPAADVPMLDVPTLVEVFDEQVQFIDPVTGKPAVNQNYALKFANGVVAQGTTSGAGTTTRVRGGAQTTLSEFALNRK